VICILFGQLCGADHIGIHLNWHNMTISTSTRSKVEPFHAMDVLAEANRLASLGHPVVSMAVGQPSDPAPEPVRETARKALEAGRIGYTDAFGIPPLRQAISRYYGEHHDLDISPSRIAVTTGSSAAFNLVFLGLFDAGDRVAITAPGYPAYRNILHALGLEAVEISLHDSPCLTGEMLRAEHARSPLDGLLFASPANPTGAVMRPNVMKSVIASARELGITTISDEIYHRLNFSGPDHTALEFDRETIVINSFSKYYCMTGWRIGWMVMPEMVARPIERLQQNIYISAPELSQHAAVRAFDVSSELDAVKARYAVNRALLAERLPQLGFRLAAPMDGAFYAYCDVSNFTNDSMEFARRMLAEAHVAATPGIDFDPGEGHRFMRFSYAGSHEEMATAMDRIETWLAK
jgi:aspartate/methionine/tyrosine aminotransferase